MCCQLPHCTHMNHSIIDWLPGNFFATLAIKVVNELEFCSITIYSHSAYHVSESLVAGIQLHWSGMLVQLIPALLPLHWEPGWGLVLIGNLYVTGYIAKLCEHAVVTFSSSIRFCGSLWLGNDATQKCVCTDHTLPLNYSCTAALCSQENPPVGMAPMESTVQSPSGQCTIILCCVECTMLQWWFRG